MSALRGTLAWADRHLLLVTLLVLVAEAALLAGFVVHWWDWLTCGDSGSTVFRNVGLVAAAMVALPLALWRSRVAEQQNEISRTQNEFAQNGQLQGRFEQGVGMLGSDSEALILAGVQSLRRLAEEYPDVYKDQVEGLLDTVLQFELEGSSSDNEQSQ